MKNPKYIQKIYALIFLCLGGTFVFIGILSFMGIVLPSEHSKVQDPIVMGIVFSLLGIGFFLAHVVLRAIGSAKDKLHNDLLAKGMKISGIVEKLHLQKYIVYGKKSPFRIFYTYTYQGENYHHKSHLLWDKPNLNKGDSITVYANDLGKSTVFFDLK